MIIYSMKNLHLTLVLFFLVLGVFAQQKEREKIPLLLNSEVTKKVQELESESQIDEILELIEKAHPKDSSYCALLTTKSYFLIQQDKYEESLDAVNQGLEMNCELGSRANLLLNKGFILGQQDKEEEAVELYLKSLEDFPKNNKLNANLANSYYKLGQFEDSYEYYKRAIQYAPTRGNLHLNFSRLFYDQGETTMAAMIAAMAIFTEPDSNGTLPRLGQFEERVSVKNPNSYAAKNKQFSPAQQKFKKLDQIINNLIVLDKNYKVDHQLSYNYVKQLSAIFTEFPNLQLDEEDFVQQVYYPFYKWLIEEDYFEEFIDVLSLKVNDEEVQKYLGKKMKKIVDFYPKALTKYYDLVQRSNRELLPVDGALPMFYYENGFVNVVTTIKNENYQGHTSIYNSNGILMAEGKYVDGERQGKWRFNNAYGGLDEENEFNRETNEREIEGFWITGRTHYAYTSVDALPAGEYKEYLPLGALKEKRNYVDGKQDGMQYSYFKTGENDLEFEYPFSKDEIDGEVKEYFADGSLYATTNYKNGKLDGAEKKYFFNGQLAYELYYKEGVPDGEYITYHLNGEINEKGKLVEGERVGKWLSYDEDGNIQEESNYANGKLEGSYKRYIYGFLVEDISFKKGILSDFNAYDKDGNILASAKKRKGEVFYQRFLPDGTLVMEGNYDVKGGKTGEWKEYHPNGNLYNVGHYEEDLAQGEFLFYYSDGETLDEIRNFKDSNLHGYYESFFVNGQIAVEGWYVDGNQHGQWKDYFINGTVKTDQYYHHGKSYATTEEYSPEGKIYSQFEHMEGWITKKLYFNPEGVAFDTIRLYNHGYDETITYKPLYERENGKDAVADYSYGVRNGSYTSFHYNDNKKAESNYLIGDLHGENKEYSTQGKLTKEENYVFGSLHGKRKLYFLNGQLRTETNFKQGALHGDYVEYHDNGELDEKGSYKNGERDGRLELYSPEGDLEIVLFYDFGKLVGYSYQNNSGDEVAMIPILKDSEVIAYFSNGQISRNFKFKNGVYDGDYIINYPSGQTRMKFSYYKGIFHGGLEEYLPDGQLMRSGQLNYGYWDGLSTHYYSNGNKKNERNYNSDVLSGESKYYNEDGNLKETRHYFNDEVYHVETN